MAKFRNELRCYTDQELDDFKAAKQHQLNAQEASDYEHKANDIKKAKEARIKRGEKVKPSTKQKSDAMYLAFTTNLRHTVIADLCDSTAGTVST